MSPSFVEKEDVREMVILLHERKMKVIVDVNMPVGSIRVLGHHDMLQQRSLLSQTGQGTMQGPRRSTQATLMMCSWPRCPCLSLHEESLICHCCPFQVTPQAF